MARVLLTGFCAVPGPHRAGVQLRHVIRALIPQHAVDLLVVRDGEQAHVERQGEARILRVPTPESNPRSQIESFQRALRRQLDGADYDIVHCRDCWSAIPVVAARARSRFAMIYDLARSPTGELAFDAALGAQYARDERTCVAAADLVLAPTAAAAEALDGGNRGRAAVTPLGVDIDRFDWDAGPSSKLPRILYVGALEAGRGVRGLVRAMAAIVRELDARLVLAGPVAQGFAHDLRHAIDERGVAERVELLGAIDHARVPALLATATVCVVPAAAAADPCPTKLLEYMACRRAIVAPRRAAIAEVVADDREALLFEPGDPQDLARTILRLLEASLLRERLADAAYDRVRRDFTASAARRAVRGAYDSIVERFEIEPDAEHAVARPERL